ncbi:MAG: hypothetical protein LLG14_04260 [Nocardiaceae bacterium]|nr:hypothetical protein [Nocardiaceae bacterium]
MAQSKQGGGTAIAVIGVLVVVGLVVKVVTFIRAMAGFSAACDSCGGSLVPGAVADQAQQMGGLGA